MPSRLLLFSCVFCITVTALFIHPAFAAPQKGEDGKVVPGGTWENDGTITGGNGEDWAVLDEVAGKGGSGVAVNNGTVINSAGSVLQGGVGGVHSAGASSQYTKISGLGGDGISLNSAVGLNAKLINYGIIRGGSSGQLSGTGTTNIGGSGVRIDSDGNTVVNYGQIYGGRPGGGGNHWGDGGAGIWIAGNENHIITAGHIEGQWSRPLLNSGIRTSAVVIQGSYNIVELRKGFSFEIGSNSKYVQVRTGGNNNALTLGGGKAEGDTFNLALLHNGFQDLDVWAKTGTSNWVLQNSSSKNATWGVYEGILTVDSGATSFGANVYQGLLDFVDNTSNLGAVEVFGAGVYAAPGGKTERFSGGALPLGRGGTATSVALYDGATAHAYSNDQYLTASGAITIKDGLNFYFKSHDWVEGQTYNMLEGASATIDPVYQGNGKYYSLAGYDFRAFQNGTNPQFQIQMLRLKNIADNPDLSYNQEKTGDRVDSLPDGDPLKDIVKHTETDKLPDALDQLSGEIYATLPTVVRNHDTRLRNSMLSSISRNALANMLCKTPQGDDPCQKKDDATGKLFTDPVCREKREAESSCPSHDLWISGGWNYSRESATNNVGMSEFTGPEVALGVDTLFGKGWGAGVFFRYSDKELELASRRSEANVRSFNFGGYGTKSMDAGDGSLRFTLGGIYGYHDIRTERHVKFSSTIADVDEEVQSGHTAHTLSAFTEVAWALPVTEKLWLEPFANIAYTNTRTGDTRETGGTMTALRVSSATQDNVDTRLGLRAAVPFAAWGTMNAELGWQHAFGDTEPKVGIGFKNGGTSYPIKGSKIARDAATIGLGLSASLSEAVTLDLTYDGLLGENSQSHTGQLMFSYHF